MHLFREPFDDGSLCVGRHTYYHGEPFLIYGPGNRIEIGAFCSIAGGAHIMGGGEHAFDLPSTYPFRTNLTRPDGTEWDIFAKGTTRLGNDVWVGFGATIMSGSTIGHGSVVAAGALVTGGQHPPYSILAGNPAKVVGRRFDDATIERLLAVRWWDWPDDQIIAFEPYFYSDITCFLDEAERITADAGAPQVKGPGSELDLEVSPVF